MPQQRTVFIGTFAHCISLTELEICPRAAIGVDESGVIRFIHKGIEEHADPSQMLADYSWEKAEVVQLNDMEYYFPGFVDTHIHASQFANAGVFGKSTLLEWLHKYTFPMEASLSDLSKAARVYNNAVYRTLSHGTTTAAYYATIDLNATNLLAKICHTRGQRAFVGQVCMDSLAPDYYTDHDAKTSVDKARQSVRYIQDTIDPTGSLIAPIITPRFAPSCSRDCLSGLGQLMKESGLLCQTHMSEVASEFDLVRETYPESRSYADVYDAAGLLNERTVLAHAIYLTARDKELIKARKAKVSHCPCSNTALGSGLAKVREILDLGIDVGLGSDVSGGYSVSILEAARQAILVGRCVALGGSDDAKLSMEEALYLATRGGAAVLGLSERIGGFEVGKQWDAQVVRLHRVPDTSEDLETGMAPVDCFGWETMKERLEKWLYTGDDRNTIAVWVKGRLVHNTKEYGR